MIKTRFAPSPTGRLHLGSARTALFSYLFAKHGDGEFLLRIEDTDRERSTKEFEKNILDGLSWLGLKHDGEIFYQSSRPEIYQKKAEELVERGLAEKKAGAVVLKILPALEKLGLKYREVEKLKTEHGEAGKSYLIQNIGRDLIHGPISGNVNDTVILRSDGSPTFHLAVVVDDQEMEITHVIRGDDHLANTPLHIILQKLFGYRIPEYAHIPMILGPDRSKLSKRHAATSVEEYRELGYLPEALVNFMALLGWNPKNDRELFSLSELISEFDLKNVNKSGAIFDIEKLNHFNAERLKNLKTEELKNSLKEFNVDDLSTGEVALIQRGGYKTLKEAADCIIRLRKSPEYDSKLLIFKKSDKEKTLKGLENSKSKIQMSNDWNQESLQKILSDAVAENNLGNGDIFWPLRVALSGEEKSPSPVELALAVGKEETIRRIEEALVKLDQLN